MRSNLENNLARGLRQQSSKYGNVTLALVGSYVIGADGPTYHFLDPGASDKAVYLPALSALGGQHYVIMNNSTVGANLLVYDADGVLVATVLSGVTTAFFSNQVHWTYLAGSVAIVFTITPVTTATYAVSASDTYLRVNRAGVVALNLPATTTRLRSGLIIKDVSGAANTNNITITPDGADTIDDVAGSIVLDVNYGVVELMPAVTGKWDRIR